MFVVPVEIQSSFLNARVGLSPFAR
jgi:hypothetical protein